MEPEVKVGRREATLVVSRRLPVTLPEIGGVMSGAFREVYGHLGRRGAVPDGPPFVIYHEMPMPGEPFEIEVCAPVRRPVDLPGGWTLTELPAGTFATLLHVGPYDTIGVSYDALTGWLGEHGFVPAGPPREVYLSEPGTPPERIHTILEFPVAGVAAPVVAS